MCSNLPDLNPTKSLLTSIEFEEEEVEVEAEEREVDLDVLAFAFEEVEEEGLDFFEGATDLATGAISETCRIDPVSS